MASLSQQFKGIIVIAFSFILIFAGTALANNDRRPPTIFYPSFLNPQSSSVSFSSTADGAEVYKQWCSTCHGDRGQGLTEEWRATWPEGKQNCWQSKCHAGNHPPDGFSFPKDVPALIGPETLTKFSTAQDLYAYTRATMPYWSPNLLADEEYLALTTFLVEANLTGRNLLPPAVWPADLTTVALRPAKFIEPSINETEETAPSGSWLSMAIFAGILLILLTVGVWLRHRFVAG